MLHKVTTVQNVFQFSSMHMHVYSRVTQVCSSDSLLVCQLTNLTTHLCKEYLKWWYLLLEVSALFLYAGVKISIRVWNCEWNWPCPSKIYMYMCVDCVFVCWFVCLLVCLFLLCTSKKAHAISALYHNCFVHTTNPVATRSNGWY